MVLTMILARKADAHNFSDSGLPEVLCAVCLYVSWYLVVWSACVQG